jgi:hypothetical protein
MPILGLRNSTTKSYSRVHTILVDNDFSSTTSFTGTNATVGVSGGKLVITDSGSGGGYASRSFITHIGTVYSYSIDYTDDNPGNGTMKFGTSANDNSLKNVNLAAEGTFTGTFTATSKGTHITILVTGAGRTLKFDNLLVQENN